MKDTRSVNLSETRTDKFDRSDSTISKNLSQLGKENRDDLKEPVWKRRYVITIVAFLIFLFTSIQRSIVSVLIVAMVNNTAIDLNSKATSESCSYVINNSTEDKDLHDLKVEGELLWSPKTQGYILGAFYIGQFFSQIPFGRLAEIYGCKWIAVGTLVISSMLTILIPPFSWISASAVIVIQILRGLSLSVAAPCVTILIANWSPKSERGFLFSIVVSSYYLGPVLGFIFAGYVSELPGGWIYAYYTVGGSGLILGVYVLFFTAENPNEDPHISQAELTFILNNQERNLSRKRPNLPWHQLLTSVPVYAYVFSNFGRFWAMSQFWIVHSTFLGTILHYRIGQNGLFTAVPNLLAFVISHIVSWTSLYIQKKNVVSIDFLRKFWTFVSSMGYSLCLMGVYITGCDRSLSVIFATLSMGSIGLGTVGSTIVSQDMSPTFSGTLHSMAFSFGSLASVILPLIVGYLTDEMRTLEQWNKVFFITIGIFMSSAITFVIFGSAKVQPWNFVENENVKNVERTDEKKSEKNDEMTKF